MTLSTHELVTTAYRALLGREPDSLGYDGSVRALDQGLAYEEFLRNIVNSDEFNQQKQILHMAKVELPDLTKMRPAQYSKLDDNSTIFFAKADDDFNFLENVIRDFNYYDSFGVWSPSVDLDKRLIAAVVQGLGAKRSFEIGCFTGPVLSVLNHNGVDARGIDVSHLAFVLAHPSVKRKMTYGDLLSLDNLGSFDVVYGMDVLEHLNPLKLANYINKINELVNSTGYVYINSPMYGSDNVFGEVLESYIPHWRESGNTSFWRQLHCDERGWPLHGHLIWAEAAWWERMFHEHELVRDYEIERQIQSSLAAFFQHAAPARKTFFVLKHLANNSSNAHVIKALKRKIDAVLCENNP